MKIYAMSLIAKPLQVEAGGPTGAYIACWIRSTSAKRAQAKAEKDIAAEGWRVEGIDEPIHQVKRPPRTGREYFEQVKTDGEVYVFHTWSGTDDESVH